jgi:hypothetical protein
MCARKIPTSTTTTGCTFHASFSLRVTLIQTGTRDGAYRRERQSEHVEEMCRERMMLFETGSSMQAMRRKCSSSGSR